MSAPDQPDKPKRKPIGINMSFDIDTMTLSVSTLADNDNPPMPPLEWPPSGSVCRNRRTYFHMGRQLERGGRPGTACANWQALAGLPSEPPKLEAQTTKPHGLRNRTAACVAAIRRASTPGCAFFAQRRQCATSPAELAIHII